MTFRHASARQVHCRPLPALCVALGVALGVLLGLGPISGPLAAGASTGGSQGLSDAARLTDHRSADDRYGAALPRPVVLARSLLRPVADQLNRLLPRGLAVALSLLLGLALVAGVFTFIISSVAGQSSTLPAQFSDGVTEIERWLQTGPLHMSSAQLSGGADQVRTWLSDHRGTLVGQALGQAGVAVKCSPGWPWRSSAPSSSSTER